MHSLRQRISEVVRLDNVELTSEAPGKRRSPIRAEPAFRRPRKDYGQLDLMPPTFDEIVGSDDPCRLVVKMVGLLDLSPLKRRLKLEGAPHYPLEMMLALEMFSKWDGEFGSRRVEKRCKFDVRYQFICQGHKPDHSTIWRFRVFLGEGLDGLLAESVKLGKRAGLLSTGRVCLDGTKLPGAASQWAKYRKMSEESDADLACDADSNACQSELGTPAASSPDGEGVHQAMAIIDEFQSRSHKDEVLPSKDPEARTMKTTHGEFLTGYNAQFAVDRDSELVMAVHVSNSATDATQLEPVLEQYLGLHDELPCDLVADAGYDTSYNAQILADLGIEACIACKDRKLFWRLDEQGRVICPMDHVAVYHTRQDKNGLAKLWVKQCPQCPLRSRCLVRRGGEQAVATHKTLTWDARAEVGNWIGQRVKSKSSEGKMLLKERGQTGELCFARLKAGLRFRRLSMWGLKGAQTEVGIQALALNLATIARKIGKGGWDALRRLFFGLVTKKQCLTTRQAELVSGQLPHPPFWAFQLAPTLTTDPTPYPTLCCATPS